MSIISDLFVDVKVLPPGCVGFIQLIYLTVTYAYFLMWASSLLISGSELLLLVPSYAGIVGSVVLPILSTLPDCCIILFSGSGPDAQSQLEVGVGALAGGTIMLLTISWFVSVYKGRVDYDGAAGLSYRGDPKLSPTTKGLLSSGVAVGPNIRSGAKILICTAGAYLFLQIPAVIYELDSDEMMAKHESMWALVGMFVCIIFFFGYIYYQVKTAGLHGDGTQDDRRNKYISEAIHRGDISLLGAMLSEMGDILSRHIDEGTPLVMQQEEELLHRLKIVLLPFFQKYDQSKDGHLDLVDLSCVIRDLGENIGHEELVELYEEFDHSSSGLIDFHEFVIGMAEYIHRNAETIMKKVDPTPYVGEGSSSSSGRGGVTGAHPRTRRLSSIMIEEGDVSHNHGSSGTGSSSNASTYTAITNYHVVLKCLLL
jgi:hypothetical protein